MDPRSKSVSVVVPTRNEAENIAKLVTEILANGDVIRQIVFVDGASTDGTRAVIDSIAGAVPIRFIEQERDKPGLAAAIMAGARAADGEFLLVMDADLSHPPQGIINLLGPLFADTADMVIGSRYVDGGSTPDWPLWRRSLSRAGAAIAYPLTHVHDSMSGFFGIRRSRLLDLAPPAVGFKIVFEAIIRGGAALRVREVPIVFRDRVRGRSKMSFGIALRFFIRWSIGLSRYVAQRLVGHREDRQVQAADNTDRGHANQ
ncbi:MAG: glycosyltransferase [Spartobacteria bacterium]